jgi:hypothetical protein
MTLYHFCVYSAATCHVDEDGGDTEEVVAGNMENPGKRIIARRRSGSEWGSGRIPCQAGVQQRSFRRRSCNCSGVAQRARVRAGCESKAYSRVKLGHLRSEDDVLQERQNTVRDCGKSARPLRESGRFHPVPISSDLCCLVFVSRWERADKCPGEIKASKIRPVPQPPDRYFGGRNSDATPR